MSAEKIRTLLEPIVQTLCRDAVSVALKCDAGRDTVLAVVSDEDAQYLSYDSNARAALSHLAQELGRVQKPRLNCDFDLKEQDTKQRTDRFRRRLPEAPQRSSELAASCLELAQRFREAAAREQALAAWQREQRDEAKPDWSEFGQDMEGLLRAARRSAEQQLLREQHEQAQAEAAALREQLDGAAQALTEHIKRALRMLE